MRQIRGWSQSELGRRCGVGKAQISKIEKDAIHASMELFLKICEALGHEFRFVPPKISPQRESIFNIVRFSGITYFPLYPPIDIINSEEQIRCEITAPLPFFIAPPRKIDEIIKAAIEDTDGIKQFDDRYKNKFDYYKARFTEGGFSKKDQFHINETNPEFSTFRSLINDKTAFEQAKIKALKDYLTKSGGYHFNGKHLALLMMQRSRRNREDIEEETIDIELQETDYYSHRVMVDLSKRIAESYGLREKLSLVLCHSLIVG